ncbi:MAG: aminopeptidase N [Proteobacteria bacterium]|nr:MAG: aminopeptidase N [Pseudomonadota bacterium]
MEKTKHNPILLSAYQPPSFLVEEMYLDFQLDSRETIVYNRAVYKKRSDNGDTTPLTLDGEAVELLTLLVNGEKPAEADYEVQEKRLLLRNLPERFTLEITTCINPEQNTELSGLYLSSGNFCTQCEAEGFRRITYYQDRPDVLTRFKTRIEADRKKYPVLLANGNLISSGRLEKGRHFCVWEDPFPKPCYLFALVAGDLVSVSDTFTTRSGRLINLEIYVQQQNRDKCGHAMQSLKKAMKWDEEVFGLEYDLDRYMIVAVDDFNMGAMENKGLNIFNSKYVLASPETATDQDYLDIEGVIAHEYFHNWTGNRVTCRDWFQLSLKEGLTVFRDQEFSADMNSRAVQRIDDVRILRQFQFKEDGGPMAHPVRPSSYFEINNFYTVTVYNKGAEVVRMIHTLLGPELFRKGMDLYFKRHDGQAVTCDDFVAAMSDASAVDLEQFKRWYDQAGTPFLQVKSFWDQDQQRLTLKIRQETRPTPEKRRKRPFHMPLVTGLLDHNGNDLSSTVTCAYEKRADGILLELTEEEQSFHFTGLSEEPVVSLLRGFSAPVRTNRFNDTDRLCFLMGHDTDLFNRWDAAFTLAEMVIKQVEDAFRKRHVPAVDQSFIAAFSRNLTDELLDKSLAARALTLPAESYLVQSVEVVYPSALHRAVRFVTDTLADTLRQNFVEIYEKNGAGSTCLLTAEEIGRRSLRNCCLGYLLAGAEVEKEAVARCCRHYYHASNMTDRIAALSVISHLDNDEKDELIDHFEQIWRTEPLVMDKWFAIQASSRAESTFKRVLRLMEHPAFSMKNPNKVRSLIGAFAANHARFHTESGDGYRFLADMIIELDRLNPQIAARLVSPLVAWRRYEDRLQELMKQQLERILSANPSTDVFEITKKSLDG